MSIKEARKRISDTADCEDRWIRSFGTPEGFDTFTTYEVLKGADDDIEM